MRESELLFPFTTGGSRAPSWVDKPVRDIAAKAEIAKTLTRRFMRRTFQDVGRTANVHDCEVRAISGHATMSMQEHYSSVSGDEVRRALAKVIALTFGMSWLTAGLIGGGLLVGGLGGNLLLGSATVVGVTPLP